MSLLLVDDHAIVRDSLRCLLAPLVGGDIYEASTGVEALSLSSERKFDLILLDLNLPDVGGLALLERLVQSNRSPVLVFSMHADPLYVTRALAAGAKGYISKNATPEELLTAVQRISGGGRYVEAELAQVLAVGADAPYRLLDQLAPRDLEILSLLVRGRSLNEISTALGLGYKTVANRLSIMKTKLGVGGTAELVRVAFEAGVS